MSSLLSPAPLVKPPSSIIPYFDVIVIWLVTPADGRTLKKLRKHCNSLKPANRIARFDSGFKQRLEFKQPDEVALRWIARRCGLLNRVEVALDLIYATLAEAEATRSYLHRHLTRRWHFHHTIVHYKNGQRYDGPRTAPNIITDYLEDHSRITGEYYCLHLEWRATGKKAVRAIGILRPRHVLTFDHRAFWEPRMRLYTVDPAQLGRMFRNRQLGTRRHRITPQDCAEGEDTLIPYETMQELVDYYSPARIGRILTPLDPEPFLPPRHILLSLTTTNYPNSDFPNNADTTGTQPTSPPPLVTISAPISRMTPTPRPRSAPYVSSDVSGKE
jgi:hypothetical protein